MQYFSRHNTWKIHIRIIRRLEMFKLDYNIIVCIMSVISTVVVIHDMIQYYFTTDNQKYYRIIVCVRFASLTHFHRVYLYPLSITIDF